MSESDQEPVEPAVGAWQPITPGGVAAFANAHLGRLLLVQFLVGAFVATALLVFLSRACVPVISEAIRSLPARANLGDGRLQWPADEPALVRENHFLSLAVSPAHAPEPGQTADFKIQFAPGSLKLASLLGYFEVPYPDGWIVALNREELAPRWGAWQPAILAGACAGCVIGLWCIWAVLALVYAWPVRTLVFFRDKQAGRLGAWKLCSAALLPGAILMGMAMLLYAFEQIPLAGLIVAFAVHLVMGLAYAVVSPMALPFRSDAAVIRGNPFADEDEARPRGRKRNPFRK